MQRFLDRVAWTVTTVGGFGFCPFAPGTVGSLIPTLIVGAARKSPHLVEGILGALGVAAIVSVPLIQRVLPASVRSGTAATTKKDIDPSFIVLDEVIGQLLTFALVSCVHPLSASTIGASFVAFRFFDILKPGPIRALERSLECRPRLRAVSVVLDDALAGVFAAIVVGGGCLLFSK